MMKQIIYKTLLLSILFSFFVPSFLYAQQNPGFNVVVPSYNSNFYDPNATITGSQAVSESGTFIEAGNQAVEGTGDSSVGSLANTIKDGGSGTSVGVSASYSAGISDGIFCTLPNRPTFGKLISYATCLLSRAVIPLIFSFAVVIFIWGVVQYVLATDDETKKKKGKQFMIWGIIALAVMSSVWGLSKILSDTFGANEGWVVPQLNTGDGSAYIIDKDLDKNLA